jgi:hypothetical protein
MFGLGEAVGYQLGKKPTPKIAAPNCQATVTNNELKTAVSLLAVMQEKYEQGEIGLEQAKLIARELVSGLNFGDNGERKFTIDDGTHATGSAKIGMEYVPWGWTIQTEGEQ